MSARNHRNKGALDRHLHAILDRSRSGTGSAPEADHDDESAEAYDHVETPDHWLNQHIAEGRRIMEEADRWDGAVGYARVSGFQNPERAANKALRSTVEHMVTHNLP